MALSILKKKADWDELRYRNEYMEHTIKELQRAVDDMKVLVEDAREKALFFERENERLTNRVTNLSKEIEHIKFPPQMITRHAFTQTSQVEESQNRRRLSSRLRQTSVQNSKPRRTTESESEVIHENLPTPPAPRNRSPEENRTSEQSRPRGWRRFFKF